MMSTAASGDMRPTWAVGHPKIKSAPIGSLHMATCPPPKALRMTTVIFVTVDSERAYMTLAP